MEGNGPVGHGGGAPGMNGDLRIYPKSGYIMVALANMAVWTLLEFEAEPGHVGALSSHLSSGLASPGWYASFGSGTEVWVIFPGRVFRYDRADASAHDEVSRYAHAAGVPDDQCDW